MSSLYEIQSQSTNIVSDVAHQDESICLNAVTEIHHAGTLISPHLRVVLRERQDKKYLYHVSIAAGEAGEIAIQKAQELYARKSRYFGVLDIFFLSIFTPTVELGTLSMVSINGIISSSFGNKY
jgi:hypothetical protein